MDLRSIYLANGTGLFLLLILRYVSRTKTNRRRAEDRVYSFMVYGVMLACCMEAASYALDGHVFPGARILNYIANTYLFSVNLLLPFCVLVYVDLGLYGDMSRIWKVYKFQIFVGAVMFAVNIVNFFIPISYYISELNVYERKPISYVYYFVILFYCITAIVTSYRYEKMNGARAFFNVKIFLLPILIGAALQFIFYGLSVAWLSSAIGLVGLFMMQQNELAYVDSLVDVYNRQYLNHIVSAWIKRGHCFAGVMLDVDHFKRINDEYGHSEGDKALQVLADILKQARRDNEWVFRFAGDEFIVLRMTVFTNGMSAYMRNVTELLKEYNRQEHAYPLAISYGTSYFDAGNIDTFMKEMDERLYEMKAEHHKND